MIHVSVLGATGRMGALAKQVIDADSNLKLHSALDSSSPMEQMLGADVVLDFTNPAVSESLVLFAIESGLRDRGWNIWLEPAEASGFRKGPDSKTPSRPL